MRRHSRCHLPPSPPPPSLLPPMSFAIIQIECHLFIWTFGRWTTATCCCFFFQIPYNEKNAPSLVSSLVSATTLPFLCPKEIHIFHRNISLCTLLLNVVAVVVVDDVLYVLRTFSDSPPSKNHLSGRTFFVSVFFLLEVLFPANFVSIRTCVTSSNGLLLCILYEQPMCAVVALKSKRKCVVVCG